MSLPIQSFRLCEVAEAGMDWAGVAGVENGGTPAVQAIGECFAFHNDPLTVEVRGCGLLWHEWLLRRSGSTSYHCLNRWDAGGMDLRLEF